MYIEMLRTLLAYDSNVCGMTCLGLTNRIKITKEISKAYQREEYEFRYNKELIRISKVAFVHKKIEETGYKRPDEYKYDKEQFKPVYYDHSNL